jgi:hypothetical protein
LVYCVITNLTQITMQVSKKFSICLKQQSSAGLAFFHLSLCFHNTDCTALGRCRLQSDLLRFSPRWRLLRRKAEEGYTPPPAQQSRVRGFTSVDCFTSPQFANCKAEHHRANCTGKQTHPLFEKLKKLSTLQKTYKKDYSGYYAGGFT